MYQPQQQANSAASVALQKPELICDRPIDDFNRQAEGQFPAGWQPRDKGTDELASRTYTIRQQALHGRWQEETVTIGIQIANWNLNEYPVLRWRWKATTLPTGGDETKDETNDTGAAVYAIWNVGFPMFVRGIKYAWSSTLPVGTRVSKRLKHDQMLVVESGNTKLNQWQTMEVNIREHARRFFGEGDYSDIDGIAIMTDADSTGTAAEAWFDDFELCRLAAK